MSKLLVRLKPYNKPKGFVCRRYIWRGVLFKGGKWCKVPAAIGLELAEHCQPGSEDRPIPLFDVVKNEAEAEALDQEKIPATKVKGAQEVSASEIRDFEPESKAADDEPESKAADEPKAQPKRRKRK